MNVLFGTSRKGIFGIFFEKMGCLEPFRFELPNLRCFILFGWTRRWMRLKALRDDALFLLSQNN